jgi:hypothetical protein
MILGFMGIGFMAYRRKNNRNRWRSTPLNPTTP